MRFRPLSRAQFGLALLKTHERWLLRLQGDALADALKTLPSRCGPTDLLMERAHNDFALSPKAVLGTTETL